MLIVSSDARTGQELLAEANEELSMFETFFREHLHNEEPLTPAEKAILRTYLHWAAIDRHQGVEEGPESPTP